MDHYKEKREQKQSNGPQVLRSIEGKKESDRIRREI
jgi:hypothetical protein